MEKNKVNFIQNVVEKGLQSQNLADVLTTITECSRFIRDNPFPNFMHSTLFRLAQAFHGEVFGRKFEHSMNTIRLRIVTAIRECSGSLRLTFCLSDDIVRIIMKVSHSNDYKARSLTLHLLASLAPMLSEDKKIHNLIIESLDCTESIEISAAIHAANELAKHSTTFPSLIIRKIGEMLGQNQQLNISNSLEIHLVEIISNIRDLTVAKSCIDLGKALLLNRPEDEKMQMTVYNSLTQLASRCSTILPNQISLLISELSKKIAQKNKNLVHCILRNLSKIASQQQYWEQGNVKTLCNAYSDIIQLESKGILCNWLYCLEMLSSNGQHSPIINEKHPWSTLLSSQCIVIRIFTIKLSHNLLQNAGINDGFRNEILESISKTLSHFIHQQSQPNSSHIRTLNRLEFLLLLSTFIRSIKCSPEFAISICKLILEAKLIESNKDLFELLAVVTETYWAECHQIVSSTLTNEIEKTQQLEAIPSIVFALLFLTTPMNMFSNTNGSQQLANFVDRLLTHPQFDHWALYKTARSALRFGHFRLVALPLLERIHKSCENMETASWISGLLHICRAQPTTFSAKELSNYESGLQFAALNFKALASTEKSQPFSFAADYANCVQSTFTGIRSILMTLNVKLLGMGNYNAGQTNEFQQKSIVQSLGLLRNSIVEARQHWVALCSKSFDADNQTLLICGLMIRQCLLLEEFLALLCGEQKKEKKLSEIPIEDLGENSTQPNAQTRNFHALLNSVRTRLLQFWAAESDLMFNLKMLREILHTLVDFQLGLPRFFFQRIQSTRIKLIINPQSLDGRTTFRVNSADLLPLIVEGIVESNNQKPIESVSVVLTLKRENAAATEKKQSVQLEAGQKYFRAQFLLKIHQKTKISAKVSFVDAVAKKQWFDETDSVSLTVELMDAGGSGGGREQH